MIPTNQTRTQSKINIMTNSFNSWKCNGTCVTVKPNVTDDTCELEGGMGSKDQGRGPATGVPGFGFVMPAEATIELEDTSVSDVSSARLSVTNEIAYAHSAGPARIDVTDTRTIDFNSFGCEFENGKCSSLPQSRISFFRTGAYGCGSADNGSMLAGRHGLSGRVRGRRG